MGDECQYCGHVYEDARIHLPLFENGKYRGCKWGDRYATMGDYDKLKLTDAHAELKANNASLTARNTALRTALAEHLERLDEAIWSERSETVRWLWVSAARNRLAKLLAGEGEG